MELQTNNDHCSERIDNLLVRNMTDRPVPTNRHTIESDSKQPERTPNISDYLRVFSYATKWDFCVYTISSLASVGAGVILPLMNIVFGRLAGQFTDYFRDSSAMSRDSFERILGQQALYIVALFVGRNTINKFCFRMIGIRSCSAPLLAITVCAVDPRHRCHASRST